jgi:hypothetical protein
MRFSTQNMISTIARSITAGSAVGVVICAFSGPVQAQDLGFTWRLDRLKTAVESFDADPLRERQQDSELLRFGKPQVFRLRYLLSNRTLSRSSFGDQTLDGFSYGRGDERRQMTYQQRDALFQYILDGADESSVPKMSVREVLFLIEFFGREGFFRVAGPSFRIAVDFMATVTGRDQTSFEEWAELTDLYLLNQLLKLRKNTQVFTSPNIESSSYTTMSDVRAGVLEVLGSAYVFDRMKSAKNPQVMNDPDVYYGVTYDGLVQNRIKDGSYARAFEKSGGTRPFAVTEWEKGQLTTLQAMTVSLSAEDGFVSGNEKRFVQEFQARLAAQQMDSIRCVFDSAKQCDSLSTKAPWFYHWKRDLLGLNALAGLTVALVPSLDVILGGPVMVALNALYFLSHRANSRRIQDYSGDLEFRRQFQKLFSGGTKKEPSPSSAIAGLMFEPALSKSCRLLLLPGAEETDENP